MVSRVWRAHGAWRACHVPGVRLSSQEWRADRLQGPKGCDKRRRWRRAALWPARANHGLGCRQSAPRRVWVLAALALGLSAASASASPTDDCNQVRDLKRQMRGCSAYIRQGNGAPQNLATAYLNRANIFARRRDYAHAFADYAAAISHDPLNPLIFYNRGNAYFDSAQYPQAIADYSRAIALDNGFTLAYLNRGLAHEREGENEAAVADYRQVLSLDPTAGVARRRLQRLQSQ